jgi:acetyl-CoA carboxylase biotin carboxyl carrier protein
MTPDDIEQIIAWLEAAGLDSLSLTTPETRLRIMLGAGAAAQSFEAASSPPPADVAPSLRARGTGVFLAAHPSADAPLVQPGTPVRAGDVVGLLRVGPLLQPVTATADGLVGRLLAEPGSLVEYGTPLMEFTPGVFQEARSTR